MFSVEIVLSLVMLLIGSVSVLIASRALRVPRGSGGFGVLLLVGLPGAVGIAAGTLGLSSTSPPGTWLTTLWIAFAVSVGIPTLVLLSFLFD